MAGSLHAQALDPWALLLDYQTRRVKGIVPTKTLVAPMPFTRRF